MNESNPYSKYRFEDFTIRHYVELLKALKSNYTVSQYHLFNKDEKFALLRHDIDISPQRALQMAIAENKEGLKATYFIHIHSEYYNVFEKEIYNIICKIISLGHDIGIHFDTHFYSIDSKEAIDKNLYLEKELLERLFHTSIHVFSFHNTNPFILSCQDEQYAGLINTYSTYFQKSVTYCSDSNGYWKFERMYDLVQSAKAANLQLLTHPEWWQEEPMSPWQKVKRCVNGRAEKNLTAYVEILKQYNNKNIDW
jgi:hypothetical protein